MVNHRIDCAATVTHSENDIASPLSPSPQLSLRNLRRVEMLSIHLPSLGPISRHCHLKQLRSSSAH